MARYAPLRQTWWHTSVHGCQVDGIHGASDAWKRLQTDEQMLSLSSIPLKSTCRVKLGRFRPAVETSEHDIFLTKNSQRMQKNVLFEALLKFVRVLVIFTCV